MLPSPGQLTNSDQPPPQTTTSNDATRHLVGPLNTRRLGKRYRFRLTKSAHGGFGIKIAERDNMYGSNKPIYITAITTSGSAYRDGRLKEGDMLLEIDGQDLASKSQPEVTKMLKEVPPDQLVEFVVSRQELNSQSEYTTTKATISIDQHQQYSDYQNIDNFPMANNQQSRLSPTDQNHKQPETNGYDAPDQNSLQFERRIDNILDMPIIDGPGTYVYDIPLKDTNSAGLGLSLKYPRTADKKYLGIFIERVINGGAAWEDGRLQQDDQILAINGIDLLNIDSYDKTTNILQAAVGRGIGPEIPSPNTIRLKIHRRDPLLVAKLLYPYNNVNKKQPTINSHYQSSNNSASYDITTSPQTQASISTNSNSSSHTSSAVSQATNANSSQATNWDDDSIEGEGKFIRDGFGRQSISEKRHAQLQAKDTDTFKRFQEKHIERNQLKQQQELHRHENPESPNQLQFQQQTQTQTQNQSQIQSQSQNIPVMNTNVIQAHQLDPVHPSNQVLQPLPSQHNHHQLQQQYYQQAQQYYQHVQQPQQLYQQLQQPAQYYHIQQQQQQVPQQLYPQHVQVPQQLYQQQQQHHHQQLPQPIMVMNSNVNQAYQSFRHVLNQQQMQNGLYGQMLNNQQPQIHHNNYHQNSHLMLNNCSQPVYNNQLIQQHSSSLVNPADVSRLSRSESFRAALDRSFDVRIIDGPGTYIYDIPLRDSNSAGLGLSLKYPQSNDKKYLGVFIESVLNGGAALDDGRLQVDDQILAINGIDLLDIDSHAEAINILKATIGRGLGPEAFPNNIRLKIHRRDPQLIAKILSPFNGSNNNNSVNNSSYHNHNNGGYDNSQGSPQSQPNSNLYHQLGSLDRAGVARDTSNKKQEVAKRARKVHYFRVLSSCVNMIRQNNRKHAK